MRLTGLQFDQVPPLNVPFRFYLTAPLFAVLAGCLLIFWGEQIWLSRWTPVTLAITHLMALGVIAMIMFGSLFQLLPVLCGTPIPISSKTTTTFAITFSLGIVALGGAFMQWFSFLPALVLLFTSLVSFAGLLIYTLYVKASGQFTRLPMLLAVISLAITLVLGLSFLVNFETGYWGAISKNWTNIHASFGTFGWVLLLIMTVSFQVIPMFHVTPEFPSIIRRYLPITLLLLLITFATELLLIGSMISFNFILALLAIYAGVALYQLKKRKRVLPDTTIKFWQVSLGTLIAATVLLLINLYAEIGAKQTILLESLIGTVMVFGVILSVIQGMLLKIVPFLITLHLQQHAMKFPMGMGLMPDHYALISRQQGQQLYKLHIITLAVAIASAFSPELTKFVGLLVVISWGLLWWMIAKAYRAFTQIQIAMESA